MAAEVEELFAIVRQLRQAGTAIVFISHRLEELFALVDRVTVLRDGNVVETRGLEGLTVRDLVDYAKHQEGVLSGTLAAPG